MSVQQLDLFAESPAPGELVIPDVIAEALDRGATLGISISGGKDSQALVTALVTEHRRRGWTGHIYAAHAHLGRAEWPTTLPHIRNLCARLGVELIVVERPQGDLVREIRERMEKLKGTGTPPWPSATNRYCTSDQKRTQLDKVGRAAPWPDAQNRYCTAHQKQHQLDKVARSPWPTSTQRYCTADQKRDQLTKVQRSHGGPDLIVVAMGMRGQESAARRKKAVVGVNDRLSASIYADEIEVDGKKKKRWWAPEKALAAHQSGKRLGLDWLPLHHWSEEDVWIACGHSLAELRERQALYREGRTEEAFAGWLAHPAYVMGNQRLSCAICVLASKSDIINGARHNPELFHEYIAIERESGFTFRQDLALEDLLPMVEPTAEVA